MQHSEEKHPFKEAEVGCVYDHERLSHAGEWESTRDGWLNSMVTSAHAYRATLQKKQYPGSDACKGSCSLWIYQQNSMLEINDKYARVSLFAWKEHGTSNAEMQSVWPPNNGLQPEHIQSVRAGSHRRNTKKSRPDFCNWRAIIVCLAHLHLKWQRPRAQGRIKECIQFNALCTSCQRGCITSPLSPPASHKDYQIPHLWPSVYFLLTPSSLQSTASAHCCPGKLLFCPGLGRSKLIVDEPWQKPILCSISFACSAKDREIFILACHICPLLTYTYLSEQRKKHFRVCTYKCSLQVCRLN